MEWSAGTCPLYSSSSVQGAISELNVYYYQCKYSELNNLFFVVLLNIENHTSFKIGIKSAYSILQLNTSTLVCFAGLRSRLLLSIVLNCELQPLSRSTIFFYPRHVRNMRVILKGVFFFFYPLHVQRGNPTSSFSSASSAQSVPHFPGNLSLSRDRAGLS